MTLTSIEASCEIVYCQKLVQMFRILLTFKYYMVFQHYLDIRFAISISIYLKYYTKYLNYM